MLRWNNLTTLIETVDKRQKGDENDEKMNEMKKMTAMNELSLFVRECYVYLMIKICKSLSTSSPLSQWKKERSSHTWWGYDWRP